MRIIPIVITLVLCSCAFGQNQPQTHVVPVPPSPAASTEADKPVTPVFPVVVHSSDGKILAVIDADGKVTGDKQALVEFLKDAKGNPTIEELILAVLADRMVAK